RALASSSRRSGATCSPRCSRRRSRSRRGELFAMKLPASALGRAFQLAKLGRYATLDHIKKRLKAEGHSTEQITGGALSKQLRALTQATRKSRGTDPAKKSAPPIDEQDS